MHFYGFIPYTVIKKIHKLNFFTGRPTRRPRGTGHPTPHGDSFTGRPTRRPRRSGRPTRRPHHSGMPFNVVDISLRLFMFVFLI